ncbi:MAG: bifunctional phosphoribosylaminoimidazolecarboxamide formyltransferase/IMP cyclohydrolase [Candidatus Undinarchaeales archaeon]
MKRALISVSDKAGIADFSKELAKLDFEIISTGGTAETLKKAGIDVIPVEEITKFPEMLDGRVKTLHPKIHAGILAKRNDSHLNQLDDQDIKPIDLVVVNLYPFEKKMENGAGLNEMIENIDIGGPTLLRAAAKNYESVAILTSPKQYDSMLKELKNGDLKKETREKLASDAFNHVARYDVLIDEYFRRQFTNEKFPDKFNMTFEKVQDLRYGDNPDQEASLYRQGHKGIVNAKKHHGKDLSYNNMLDMQSAWTLANEFEEPAVAIIKHNEPCGVAVGENLTDAYERALSADPISAYGSVIGVNRPLDNKTAKKMIENFVEVVIAEKYEPGSIDILKNKKTLRIMELLEKAQEHLKFRGVQGGLVLQTLQEKRVKKSDLKIVTKKKPTEKQIEDMLFAFNVVKYVVSNSIVFAKDKRTTGLCGGQTSRVDAVKFSAQKAGDEAEGSVMASDAFFPFRDGIDEAVKAGIKAVIQPGGSIRDEEVIEAADEHGIAMVFTGRRVFRH